MKEEGVQYTIAYMHWGTEYQTQQSQEQTDMAQRLCDMGIDTLIGSHPHLIQPVDRGQLPADTDSLQRQEGKGHTHRRGLHSHVDVPL